MFRLLNGICNVLARSLIWFFSLLFDIFLNKRDETDYCNSLRSGENEVDESIPDIYEIIGQPDKVSDDEVYIYTQLEGLSMEFDLAQRSMRECRRKLKLHTVDEKTREKLNKQIVQAYKVVARTERDIRKLCAKYDLDANDYLGNTWET